MQYWNTWQTPEQLLDLFGIDPESEAGDSIVGLAVLFAIVQKYPAWGVTMDQITTAELRLRRLSPVVFWSRIKRAAAPILGADAATLEALGLAPMRPTGRGLCEAMGRALAGSPRWHIDESDAADLAAVLGRG